MLLSAILSYGKVPEVDRTLTAEDVKERKSVGFRMADRSGQITGFTASGTVYGSRRGLLRARPPRRLPARRPQRTETVQVH